jgi:hypothetical protein
LELACAKQYRSRLPLAKENEGGGGTLGIKPNKRDVDGKPIYLDDPEGYFLYIV